MSTLNFLPTLRRDISTIPHRLFQIFWDSDLQATKLALSVSALIWGSLLCYPTEELFVSTTYVIMRVIAPQWLWALAFIIQFFSLFYSLVVGRSNGFLFITGPFLGCILWTASCGAMFFSSYPPPAAISAEVTSAIISWWILIRWLGDYQND